MKKLEQIEKAKSKLMFLKTQDNLKDIVYINAILEEYQRICLITENDCKKEFTQWHVWLFSKIFEGDK